MEKLIFRIIWQREENGAIHPEASLLCKKEVKFSIQSEVEEVRSDSF